MRWYAWVIGIAVNLAVVGSLVAVARRRAPSVGRRGDSGGHGARRAALLGVAGGAAFGLTAALMKGMTETFAGGFGELLTSWQLYAMIAAGAGGVFLVQSAMNAGRLLAAQPGLTLSDPVVSILWGVLAFGEQVRGGWYLLLATLSGLVMAGAVVFLARSPLLSGSAAVAEDAPQGRQEITPARQRQ